MRKEIRKQRRDISVVVGSPLLICLDKHTAVFGGHRNCRLQQVIECDASGASGYPRRILRSYNHPKTSPPPIHLGSNRRTKGSKQSKKILSFSHFRLLIILLLLDPPAIVESDQAFYQEHGALVPALLRL
ncbi:hypothetical protein DdX_01268 [Ditylenchus destructor]|uniref:Uncharacterized protein n=1 Tax=Ditylenchus destructor TaxID=166010 RepID=A0AAD4RDT9_9BILA|nr:hypothetical protein DdX_01268 [Ditylenchus destructor]